jgi:hypothetical protein
MRELFGNGLQFLAVSENTGEDIECSVLCSHRSRNEKAEVRITFNKPSLSFWELGFHPRAGIPDNTNMPTLVIS